MQSVHVGAGKKQVWASATLEAHMKWHIKLKRPTSLGKYLQVKETRNRYQRVRPGANSAAESLHPSQTHSVT